MKEVTFQSNLSYDEIEENFKNVDFFNGIMDGLQEALFYEKGAAKVETFSRKASLPDINVAEERKALKMTQKTYAKVLGVSSRTVEAWESGKSNPSPTARNLMYLLSVEPRLVDILDAKSE